MHKFLICTFVASATVLATPAAAQYANPGRGYGYNQGWNIEHELDQIRQQINQAEHRGLVSRREARRLMLQADRIDLLANKYRRNGLNQRERRDIQNRIHNLRQQIRFERREGRRENRY